MGDIADEMRKPTRWWTCPNTPNCGHGAIFHDVAELDDPRPTCCVEGCDCGKGFPLIHTSA